MATSLPPVVYRLATEDEIAHAEAFSPIGEKTWRGEFFSPLKSVSVLAIARSQG
jgi:hypothetical protein